MMVKPKMIATLLYTETLRDGTVLELFRGRWPHRRVSLSKLHRKAERNLQPYRANRERRSRMRSLYGRRR